MMSSEYIMWEAGVQKRFQSSMSTRWEPSQKPNVDVQHVTHTQNILIAARLIQHIKQSALHENVLITLQILLSAQDKVDSIQFCHSGERYNTIIVFIHHPFSHSSCTEFNVTVHTVMVQGICCRLRFVSGSRDGTARIWKLHQRQQWRCILLNMSATLPG